ncbi:hypothetical protein Adt_18006 [Abeliophyllum distichum]|uniref:Uncharacterized protein n=1 Tax=Abeliophyllum distichum TaxID=126358 RepID=A0ABD1TI47_9LAMI
MTILSMSYNFQFPSVTASLHLLDKSLPIGELQIFTGKSSDEGQISTGESPTNSKYRPNPNTHHLPQPSSAPLQLPHMLLPLPVLYHPNCPVTSLKISQVNLTITTFDDGCGG